jgi:hypothetical protein
VDSGLYEGSFDGNPSARLAKVNATATWRGRPAAKIGEFQASAKSTKWTHIQGPVSLLRSWATLPQSERDKLELCVNLLPYLNADGTRSTTTLREGAAGRYDPNFKLLGQNLAAHGLAKATLRFGHEFNGTWYRWSVGRNVDGGNPSAGSADGGAGDFRTYVRRAVVACRTGGWVGKSTFNPNNGVSGSGVLAETCYPGDDVVDHIGPDFYDQSWVAGTYPYPQGATAEQVAGARIRAWADIRDGKRGLVWWRDFARAHGKTIAYPEWGCYTRPDGHGGGDNPYFVNEVWRWFVSLGDALAYEIMFNVKASDGDHQLYPVANLPKASAEYQRLWRAACGAPLTCQLAPGHAGTHSA